MNKREVRIGSMTRLAVILLGLVASAFVVWCLADSSKVFAAAGLIALFIVCLPFLQLREYDLFCPWTFVIMTLAILCTPQAICMSFSFPDEETIERMMFVGQETEFFIYPIAVFLLGLICLTIGYFAFQARSPIRFSVQRRFNLRNTTIVLVATLALSTVSTAAFVRATGGIESGRISDKRTSIETLDVESSNTRQYGYLRHTSKLASVVFLIAYSVVLCQRGRLNFFEGTLIFVTFLAAAALPFYASSRQQVGWVVLNAIGINYYFGRKFLIKLAIIGFAGLTVFLLMSQLRARDSIEAMETASLTKSFESVVLNRNGPGISKTAQIINHIPEKLEFKYGATFANWLIAPIPRELYPNKPLIGVGPEVGTKIYGTRTSGVPPGFIAELYWNFHLAGVIFGMLAFGWLLKFIYQTMWQLDISPAILVPVYLFSVMPVAFSVLGNSLGYGTMMRLVDFATICTIIYLCTSRTRSEHFPVPRYGV